MSTEFRVQTNSLGDVARLLQSAITVFDARLADTSGVVSSVAGASWQGEDAEMFTLNYSQWETGALQLRMILENLSTTLIAAERTYESMESGLDSGFDSVTESMASGGGQPSAVAASVGFQPSTGATP